MALLAEYSTPIALGAFDLAQRCLKKAKPKEPYQ